MGRAIVSDMSVFDFRKLLSKPTTRLVCIWEYLTRAAGRFYLLTALQFISIELSLWTPNRGATNINKIKLKQHSLTNHLKWDTTNPTEKIITSGLDRLILQIEKVIVNY